MQRFDSSMIAAMDYDAANKQVTVTFRTKSGEDGQEWLYRAVPPDVYEAVAGADSIGAAFGKLIRNRFTGERLA